MGQTTFANRALPQLSLPVYCCSPHFRLGRLQWTLQLRRQPPLVPIRCRDLIHNKPSTRASWAFRARNGFYVGPALQHYCCFQVLDTATKSNLISNTVEFRHDYLAQPTSTHADWLIHALHFLSSALKETPSVAIDDQLDAISQLHDLFQNWKRPPHPQDPPTLAPNPPPAPKETKHPPPRVPPH